MRYSLATFLLVILLIAALMLVWLQCEPWVRTGVPENITHMPSLFDKTSPDGTRETKTRMVSVDGKIVAEHLIIDTSGPILLSIYSRWGFAAYFVTDNELLVEDGLQTTSDGRKIQLLQRYHRRHPEWWWGHLYRPEVWASLILFTILVARFIRARRQQKLTIPTHPEVSSIPS